MDTLQRIEQLTIGPAEAALGFGKRLARENGWNERFAERVIGEYKRFIYLVSIAKHELTPSDQIDQAWHLHLTYTHSYWGDLCRDILGCDLHHLPTAGGPAEQARFREQYQQTLDLYAEIFDENPPEEIWPPVAIRFADVERFVRLNRAHAWIIRWPRFFNTKTVLATTLPLMLVACSEGALADKDIWFWLKALFGAWVIYKVVAWLGKHSKGGDGGCGSACGGCGGCGGD